MDVWFDSGSTHAGVLDARDYLKFPADIYLEGGDQYRGWFQSSMLTSITAKGVAPYKQIITHGWTVDGEGKAMHKSLGNTVAPEEVIKDYGADMLRLWVSSTDYTQDVRISKDIMKQLSQAYLKIRNTARYMLGNLDGFDPNTLVPVSEMAELDRWALSRFNDLVKTVRDAYDRYEFHAVYRAIYNFCVVDMSNIYLDIIKDRLYCDDGLPRASAQTALYRILDGMTRLLAPILAFTSQEIWAAMPHDDSADAECVLFNDIPDFDPALALSEEDGAKWADIIALRGAVNKALEIARTEQGLKKSTDTAVTLYFTDAAWDRVAAVRDQRFESLFIVSQAELVHGAGEGYTGEEFEGLTVRVTPAAGEKCPRCWNHDVTIGTEGGHAELCARCARVLGL